MHPITSKLTRGAARAARLGLTLAALVALSAGVGVATGAIPDSTTNAISSCLSPDGSLRVIDTATQACSRVKHERRLDWNQSGPAAFADIAFEGRVVDSRARGIDQSDVTKPGRGVYCFELDFEPKHAQVTLNAGSPSVGTGAAIPTPRVDIVGAIPCPASSEASVRMADPDTGFTLRDHGFLVAFDR
jgi:hypothetical protein